MGTTTSAEAIQAADKLLVAHLLEVAELRRRLAAAFRQGARSAEMDRLLVQANDLFAAVVADMNQIRNDLGPDYDLDQFKALADDIHYAVTRAGEIPLNQDYVFMLRKLPKFWTPVGDTAGHHWFRGVSLNDALTVFTDDKFNSMFVRHGTTFGKGTYFAPTIAGTSHYGKCVFAIRSPGPKVLRALQLSDLDQPRRPGWDRIETMEVEGTVAETLGWDAARRITNSGEFAKTTVQIAREQGYDAVELVESAEGHILIVLRNLPLCEADVVVMQHFTD
jgi:hypothetical protein